MSAACSDVFSGAEEGVPPPLSSASSSASGGDGDGDGVVARLDSWLATIPIGRPGPAGATSKRHYDAAPLAAFARRENLEHAPPAEIYRRYTEQQVAYGEACAETERQLMAAEAAAAAQQQQQQMETDNQAPLKEGWLWKQGHVVKNWKRRWFVLWAPAAHAAPHVGYDDSTACLLYYESKEESEQAASKFKGCIPLLPHHFEVLNEQGTAPYRGEDALTLALDLAQLVREGCIAVFAHEGWGEGELMQRGGAVACCCPRRGAGAHAT
jgi:hypothetical protein